MLRKERGLSQERLAEAAGLNLSYLSAVERGDNSASVLTLVAISGALGVSLQQLVAQANL